MSWIGSSGTPRDVREYCKKLIDTAEQEYKAGAAVAGFSFGVFGCQVYSVTSTQSDGYHGEVGSIAPADFGQWWYEFGPVVYDYGLCPGEDGLWIEPNVIPFQIETYYTVPQEFGYRFRRHGVPGTSRVARLRPFGSAQWRLSDLVLLDKRVAAAESRPRR